MKTSLVSSFVCLIILTACGGGGGGGSATEPTNTTSSANGYWNGQTSQGKGLTAVIDEQNNAYFITYTKNTSGNLSGVDSVATAKVSVANGSLTSSDARIYYGTGDSCSVVTGVTITGTVVNKSSLSLSASGSCGGNSSTVTSSLTYDSLYDTAANLSSIAGTYDIYYAIGKVNQSGSGTVTINSSGVVSSTIEGCTTTGNLVGSSKNYFTVTLSSGGSNCYFGSEILTGIAGLSTNNNNKTAIVLTAFKSDKSDGLLVIGAKR